MGFILPIITAILLGYADLQSKKKLKKNIQGQYLLKLNKSFKWLGIICCFICSVLVSQTLLNWNPEIVILGPLTCLMFLLMGLLLLIPYYRYTVLFDTRKIQVTGALGKTKQIEWTAVEKVSFNSITAYLKLVTPKEKVTINRHTIGFDQFLEYLELHTRFKAKDISNVFKY
ncbi:hypothetical protein [Leeuwenhoekiella sp. H156]|uniref:hypothetical protein n=1 Tax=Leeuwenhoekiella sp. H156 TaxID=3450128 RepID=UPI003FA45307